MVELIKSAHKRGVIANVLHALFNVAYVVTVAGLVVLLPDTPWPAFILVLVAKWRIIAVRPRHWWANILSNLPDTLFGLGIVILMWLSAALLIQIILAVLYMAWLIVLKPQHHRRWVMMQAGVSQAIALIALFSVSHFLPVWAVVGMVFVVGFSTARQVVLQYDEKYSSFLALIWGLILAEIGFVAWHWAIAYQITSTLQIPQFAIIAAVLGLAAERGYVAWQDDKQISWSEVGLTAVFAAAVIVMLLFFFSGLFDATTL